MNVENFDRLKFYDAFRDHGLSHSQAMTAITSIYDNASDDHDVFALSYLAFREEQKKAVAEKNANRVLEIYRSLVLAG
jgi:hypothetical protein